MYRLQLPSVHLHSIHPSVSPKVTHILREKTGQKPQVMATPSAQLLSMAAELNISMLYGREKDDPPARGATVMAAIVKCWNFALDREGTSAEFLWSSHR